MSIGTALITGASSGIGEALARHHASLGGNLVITARNETSLTRLKTELETSHQVKVDVVVCDLAAQGGPQRLIDAVEALEIPIPILINNAGFGGHGKHIDRPLADEIAMIDLNVKALVTLTHYFARKMVAQGGGKILQVGSTAGFVPGPNQAMYFATKHFVKAFSLAIDQEMRPAGVTCTLLAPGHVETNFAKAANLEGTPMASRGGASAQQVARAGYNAMIQGRLVVINDKMLAFVVGIAIRVLPTRMILGIMERFQAK